MSASLGISFAIVCYPVYPHTETQTDTLMHMLYWFCAHATTYTQTENRQQACAHINTYSKYIQEQCNNTISDTLVHLILLALVVSLPHKKNIFIELNLPYCTALCSYSYSQLMGKKKTPQKVKQTKAL